MKPEPIENDSGVERYERTATIVTKDDGTKRLDVGLTFRHDEDSFQYILHRILMAVHEIEMDIKVDKKSTVDAFNEQQKQPTFIIESCLTNRK